MNPNADNLVGAQALKLVTSLTSYSGVTAVELTFTVNVSNYVCNAATVYTATPAAMLTAYTYQIGTGAYTFTAPTFLTAPFTCTETVTYAL